MSDPSTSPSRRVRTQFTLGIVLLLIGCVILLSYLGIVIPFNWWKLWPWLLIVLGAAQFVWPGSFRERMAGYWLLVVGGVGIISEHELFGLDWGSTWPIFIIAAGLRVILGGVSRHFKG